MTHLKKTPQMNDQRYFINIAPVRKHFHLKQEPMTFIETIKYTVRQS